MSEMKGEERPELGMIEGSSGSLIVEDAATGVALLDLMPAIGLGADIVLSGRRRHPWDWRKPS